MLAGGVSQWISGLELSQVKINKNMFSFKKYFIIKNYLENTYFVSSISTTIYKSIIYLIFQILYLKVSFVTCISDTFNELSCTSLLLGDARLLVGAVKFNVL